MIKLLIYDDNKERCESLKALLMMTEGMECVASYPDCRDVVEQMRIHQPDIVLMDIAMPYVDGIKAVEIIKKNFPRIRIIMQTVFEDEEKIFASLKAGAEGYLLKNATAEKITQSIEEVYHGGASMTPSVALRVMKYFNQEGSSMADDYNLSPREKEVLGLLSDGNSYKMVADKLGISYYTVNAHVKKIYEKLHVHSLGEAVSLALKNRIV